MIHFNKRFGCILALPVRAGFLFAVLACAAVADEPEKKDHFVSPEHLQFFETRVRPLLAKHCYRCHGEKKQEGSLRLDLRSHAFKGGESGKVIIPGNAEESLLVESIKYESLEMPPDKKMSQRDVAVISRWIELGAPWKIEKEPAETVEGDRHRDVIREKAKTHWAFQPVEAQPVPSGDREGWSRNEIDRFVLQQQRKAGLSPSPRAQKRTLLRRAFFDLLGMPPSMEEADEFLNDQSPQAFSRLVDRLLDDSRYGERWGRHWLDVARYADSKGAIFGEPRQYPYAYTYRDYVIRSFNEDKPYDQFVREQLAADLLTDRKNDPALAALGFLTVHRRLSQSRIEEQWVDRVDTVTRGLLGLTVACAQCHDHKYDPIPSADFYSLYGVFASLEEPDELPVIGKPKPGSRLERDYMNLVKQEDLAIQQYKKKQFELVTKKIRSQAGEYLLVVRDGQELSAAGMQSLAGKRKLNPYIAIRWKKYLESHPNDAVLGAWNALSAIPREQWAEKSPQVIAQIAANRLPGCSLNPLISRAFQSVSPANLKEVSAVYQELFSKVDRSWQAAVQNNSENRPAMLADENEEQIRLLLYGKNAPGVMPPGDFKMLDRPTYLALLKMNENRLIKLAVHPGAPRRAMVVRDKKELFEPHILIRGDIERPGKKVPRQFLGILSGENRRPFQQGAGRLELAEAIVAPENPLTARVFVNRIWHYHFGRGLVTTPSDFGLQTPEPVQRQLLDYLAHSFVENGWSVKYLHRIIMNSATYQQSSDNDVAKQAIDPENKYLWKFNHRRLEYEAIHDSLLAVAGKLDRTRGGPPVEMIKLNAFSYTKQSNWEFNPYRRAVYGVVARENLPSLLFTFDFADPATSNAARNSTTVPTQSLYMMNNGFIMEMAAAVVAREDVQKYSDKRKRITRLFQILYNRKPTEGEQEASLQFIEAEPATEVEPAEQTPQLVQQGWQYGYARYNSEQGTHELKKLFKFPFFSGSSFQGSLQIPDKTNGLGWLRLTASGGHAGSSKYCTVCRWISPDSGVASVTGVLKHLPEQGDGVKATLYGPRGKIGQWQVHRNQIETRIDAVRVEKGDILDFVVDHNDQNGWDGYQWAPVIQLKRFNDAGGKRIERYSARESFPKMKKQKKVAFRYGPWERFAQVLLMSNEFSFIE